jgi:hypothetical protein
MFSYRETNNDQYYSTFGIGSVLGVIGCVWLPALVSAPGISKLSKKKKIVQQRPKAVSPSIDNVFGV